MKMVERLSDIESLLAEGQEYDEHVISNNTKIAYEAAWHAFEEWCSSNNFIALPSLPDTVMIYATLLARRLKPSSIKISLAAIRHYHLRHGMPSPTQHPQVRKRIAGINRMKRVAPAKKQALLIGDIDAALTWPARSLRDIRNRAILAVGWAAGLRRSELVGLDLIEEAQSAGFVRFANSGMELVLNCSKTDPLGERRTIAIPFRKDPSLCPVRLLQAWIEAAGIQRGPIFRPVDMITGELIRRRLHASVVAQIVKKTAKRLGFDPHQFAGHSLRSGFVTSTVAAGASVPAVQATTGHKRLSTLFGYVRLTRIYQDSPLLSMSVW